MSSLPVVRDSLELYIKEINRFSLLSREEESELAMRWYEHQDVRAAHQLITANLRFVVKVANEFKRYGAKLKDLIQEGNIGLMMAVKKFNPHRGYRVISYAVWWIRAYIQNFIIRTWSLVKIGTTQAQRKLFFKLREARRKIEAENREDRASELAKALDVRDSDVIEMELRLAARDFSLDAKIDGESNTAHLDTLPDHGPSQEEVLARAEQQVLVRKSLEVALNKLNERERTIIEQRLLAEKPRTLKDLGEEMNISRERVRQIEEATKKKMRKYLAPALAG